MFGSSKQIYSGSDVGPQRKERFSPQSLNEATQEPGNPMAKTIHKSPTISGQLEPLLKAAALRRLQQEPARVSNTKATKAPAKKRKKA